MSDTAAAAPKQVLLQKIYVKDASIEVPQAPQIFARPWKPNVDVQVATAVSPAGTSPEGGDHFQVILTVTVTAKLENDVAFLAEVQQGGLFLLKGLPESEERNAVLGGYCPGVLLPFAREFIASATGNAGFPPILLQPINFDAVYQQSLAQAREQQAANIVPPGVTKQ